VPGLARARERSDHARGEAGLTKKEASRSASPAKSHAPRPGGAPVLRLFDPAAPWLIPLAIALASRVWQATLIPFAAEDSYITFRFAENWAHGLGPVYNAGDRVFGFSSPLWTAWLALGSAVFGSAFSFARISGIAFDLVALFCGTRVLEKEHGRFSAWIFALFFAVHPIFAANAVLGMETSLFLALLMASAWALQVRHRATGVLIGLLTLVRPEAIIAAAIALLVAPARHRLVAFGIAALGYGALAAYFGSPIPQSVLAKAATYGIAGPFAGLQWIEGILPWFVSGLWPVTPEGNNLLPLALVFSPAAVAGALLVWRQRSRKGVAWIVGAAGMTILLVYFALGVPFFFWYAVVPIAGWSWLAAIGLPLISRHRFLYASLALYILSDTILLQNLYAGRVKQEALSFWQAGTALNEVARGRGTVFLEPIGHVGYLTKLRVIDEVGLVAPRVAQRRVQGPGWYADIVSAERPDYLVVRAGFFQKNESFAGVSAPFRDDGQRDAVLAGYEKVDLGNLDASMEMSIYRRRQAN
jgi:hypothetical protein